MQNTKYTLLNKYIFFQFFCDEEVASLLCQFKPLLLKANIDVNAVEYGHDKFELLNDTLYTK